MARSDMDKATHRRLYRRRESAWSAYVQAAAYMRRTHSDADWAAWLRALDRYLAADKAFKAADDALRGPAIPQADRSPPTSLQMERREYLRQRPFGDVASGYVRRGSPQD